MSGIFNAMTGSIPADIPVVRASRLSSDPDTGVSKEWRLDRLCGRLTEVIGFARLSAAAVLVSEAHRCGKDVAWVSAVDSLFFPPDLERWGVAVDRIPVVLTAADGNAEAPAEGVASANTCYDRSPDVAARSAQAAEALIRTGAFALIVLDLGEVRPATRLLGRLLRLAGTSSVAVVALTEGDPSLGSLVGVRVNTSHSGPIDGRLTVDITAVKDKRRRPYWRVREVCCAPDGMY